MKFKEAIETCHVRSAIYCKGIGKRYWKNHPIPLKERVSLEEQIRDDWEEYDPRDEDGCSLFMFND